MVIWSEPAKEDLKQIHSYIAQDSAFYAQKVLLSLIKKSEMLTEFPEMGRIVPELSDDSIRELIIYSYRMVYEISEINIVIHAVIHAKRDFDEAVKNRVS